jgi:membrane protease YdiL (CAAX protease family)
MIKVSNNFKLAWEVIIILFFTTILMLLLYGHLRNLINDSNFLWTIYFYIPILVTLMYAFLKNRTLIRFFSFRIEVISWDRYFWFLAILTGYFFLLVSLKSNIKISSILLYIQRLQIASGDFSYMFYFKEIIFSPVTEEILFRGIILSGFLIRYSPIKAIVLSSFIFSLFHFNAIQFVTSLFMGLLCGWYFFKTRNLLSCILIHLFNNLIKSIAIKYFIDKFSHQIITSNTTLLHKDNLWLFILVSLVLIIVGLFYLYYSIEKNPQNQSINE